MEVTYMYPCSKKEGSRWHPRESLTDTDYTVDLAFFANKPAQAGYLRYHMEQEARDIGLYSSDKTNFMDLNQDAAISSINCEPRNLVDQFIYLGSNISSTESNVNMCRGKAWTAIIDYMEIWSLRFCFKLYPCQYYCIVVLFRLLEKKQDENYTRMLHALFALNPGSSSIQNKQLYDNLSLIPKTIEN